MSKQVVLVTGFPTTFLATRVVRKLLRDSRDVEIRCIVQGKALERARELIAAFPKGEGKRVVLLEGDIAAMDLGLSGQEFNDLAGEIDIIHHCAAVTYLGVAHEVAEEVNVGGAREILELADAARHLSRLVHWSSALVSGPRRGYVLEEELTASDFRNPIEETRFRAERIIRSAAKEIPTTILRPSIIVGDSVTGEIDRLEGPYLLVLLMLNAPTELRVPMPSRGDIPLNLVPIDYVVDAGCTIAQDRRSVGRTFHIADPDPLSARKVFELIAKAADRPIPRGILPAGVASAILRAPGVDRFAHVPRAFLEQLGTEVVYDDRNCRELLGGRGLACPRFESYVGTLVDHVRGHQAAQRERRREGATAG